MEEAHGGELVRLQLPGRGDHERGCRAGVAEDERRGGERDDEGARGRRQQPARGLSGDQRAEPPRPRPRRGGGGGRGRGRRLGGRGAREVPEEMTRATWRRERGEEAGGGRGGRGGGGGGHWAAVACACGARGVERAQPPAAAGVWTMMSGRVDALRCCLWCCLLGAFLLARLASSCQLATRVSFPFLSCCFGSSRGDGARRETERNGTSPNRPQWSHDASWNWWMLLEASSRFAL